MPPEKVDGYIDLIVKRFEEAICGLKEFLTERDRRYGERFEATEVAKNQALHDLDHQLDALKAQVPTTADFVELTAKVENLMQSKAMLEGKASQSSVQIILVLTVLGMMISFCAAATAILSLTLHIAGII